MRSIRPLSPRTSDNIGSTTEVVQISSESIVNGDFHTPRAQTDGDGRPGKLAAAPATAARLPGHPKLAWWVGGSDWREGRRRRSGMGRISAEQKCSCLSQNEQLLITCEINEFERREK